jgi:CubicO group peptidase (beta-lactamase class C family)
MSRRLGLLLLLVVLVLVTSPAVRADGAAPNWAEIDAYVQTEMARGGFPGLAYGVVQDGQLAHAQGFGIADPTGRAVTPQTPFDIGSIGKTFTALAIRH